MKIFCTVLFLILSLNLGAQEVLNSNEIATINGMVITSDEFLERIELNPQFRKNIKRFTPALKLEFLLTLIAEKLQAEEARYKGLDTTEAIRTAISSIEKMYVRDALFNKEIRLKINVDESEHLTGVIRNQTIFNVRYIFSTDSLDVAQQFSLLEEGRNFDSLIINRVEFEDQKNPILVYYGDLVKSIEDALYQLQPNEYTKPLPGPDGWYIFYVYNTIDNSAKTPEEKEGNENTVRKILESELGEQIQGDYYRSFFSDKNVDVDRQLFDDLFEQLNSIFKNKSLIRNPEATTLIHLDAYDVNNIKRNIGSEKLKTSFVQLDQNPVALNDFINEIAFNGYSIEKYNRESLREKLSVDVRIFIERELLAREGYRQGLQNDPEVRKYMSMWSDHYLSQSYVSTEIEQVQIQEKEVKEYYVSQNKASEYSELVNIIEIYTTDIKIAEKVNQLAKKGTEFKSLAKEFNERVWTKSTDGEYGLFPVHMFGKVGKAAKQLAINEISEMINLDDGYSIIKVIDRKQQKSEPPTKSYEELKNQLSRELAYQKKIDDLIKNTSRMANENEININYNALNSIEITNINSFAIRVMGFGGKITPVPIVKPFVEWVDGWNSKSNVLP